MLGEDMNPMPESQTHCACNTQKTCTLGVLLIILFGVAAVAFLVFFCDHKSFLNNLNKETALMAAQGVQGSGVAYELFLSTITEFYTNVIVILTALLGILSIVGFLYIKNISNKEVVKEVDDAILSEHFKAYLKDLVQDTVSKEIDDNSDIADIVEKYGAIPNLTDRIEFLERIIMTNSLDRIEIGRENNGSNPTIK